MQAGASRQLDHEHCWRQPGLDPHTESAMGKTFKIIQD